MITLIITFAVGVLVGAIGMVGLAAYYYYKGVHEAHQDGWDMPN